MTTGIPILPSKTAALLDAVTAGEGEGGWHGHPDLTLQYRHLRARCTMLRGLPDPESRFIGLPLRVDYLDGVLWRLVNTFSYRIATGRMAGQTVTANAGFVFDWASVPWWLWWLLPPPGLTDEPYGAAAVFHDWICRYHAVDGKPCTRAEADDLFYEIMVYVGVAPWRAWVMWKSVLAAGHFRQWPEGDLPPIPPAERKFFATVA